MARRGLINEPSAGTNRGEGARRGPEEGRVPKRREEQSRPFELTSKGEPEESQKTTNPRSASTSLARGLCLDERGDFNRTRPAFSALQRLLSALGRREIRSYFTFAVRCGWLDLNDDLACVEAGSPSYPLLPSWTTQVDSRARANLPPRPSPSSPSPFSSISLPPFLFFLPLRLWISAPPRI